MTWAFGVAGLLLLTVATVDTIWTILWVEGGAGPLSGRILHRVRQAVGAIGGRGDDHAVSLAGPFILVSTLLAWVLLVWTGWSLVFLADEGALVHARTGVPAGVMDRVYFVGYTVFTLGNGEYSPQGALWQIATVLANASGMLLITLAVTYLVTILTGAVQKRVFAGQVMGLGKSGPELVVTLWAGGGFRGLDGTLSGLALALARVTEQHLAYPVLHNYHAGDRTKAPAVAAAVLDEGLTLLQHGVAEEHRPRSSAVAAARTAVTDYLGTLHRAFIEPASDPPSTPSLAPLREAGIPTVSDDAFRRAIAHLTERRRLLCGAVEADGWTWDGTQGRGPQD